MNEKLLDAALSSYVAEEAKRQSNDLRNQETQELNQMAVERLRGFLLSLLDKRMKSYANEININLGTFEHDEAGVGSIAAVIKAYEYQTGPYASSGEVTQWYDFVRGGHTSIGAADAYRISFIFMPTSARHQGREIDNEYYGKGKDLKKLGTKIGLGAASNRDVFKSEDFGSVAEANEAARSRQHSVQETVELLIKAAQDPDLNIELAELLSVNA